MSRARCPYRARLVHAFTVNDVASPKQNHYVIQIGKPWHVAWWAEYFGVSEEVILDAVRKVGDQANAVEAFLAQDAYHRLPVYRRR